MNEELKDYILENIKYQYNNIDNGHPSLILDENLIKEYMFICENYKEKYPVDIDILIKLNFYSVKRDAKKRLVDDFILNIDYIVSKNTKNTGGRPLEDIKLTIECFKTICIMSHNEQGKKIRKFYISLEFLYKKYMKEVYEVYKKENDEIKNKLLKKTKRT